MSRQSLRGDTNSPMSAPLLPTFVSITTLRVGGGEGALAKLGEQRFSHTLLRGQRFSTRRSVSIMFPAGCQGEHRRTVSSDGKHKLVSIALRKQRVVWSRNRPTGGKNNSNENSPVGGSAAPPLHGVPSDTGITISTGDGAKLLNMGASTGSPSQCLPRPKEGTNNTTTTGGGGGSSTIGFSKSSWSSGRSGSSRGGMATRQNSTSALEAIAGTNLHQAAERRDDTNKCSSNAASPPSQSHRPDASTKHHRSHHADPHITFRFIHTPIEEEYSYHKRESIIGKGAYSVVYRAVRMGGGAGAVNDMDAEERPPLPQANSVVALKVISKIPEGFHGAGEGTAATGAQQPPKLPAAAYDDRRDDVLRELEVLNRLRCANRRNCGLYNGCLQLVDALETSTHWCLVTQYDPKAVDLTSFYKRRAACAIASTVPRNNAPQCDGPIPIGGSGMGVGSCSQSNSASASLTSVSTALSSNSARSAHSSSPPPQAAPTIITEQHAALIIVQLLAIIRRLHDEQRLVHRDLKPENLLLAPVPTGTTSYQQQINACLCTERSGGSQQPILMSGPISSDENKKLLTTAAAHRVGSLLLANAGGGGTIDGTMSLMCDENKRPSIRGLTSPTGSGGGGEYGANGQFSHDSIQATCTVAPNVPQEILEGGLVTLLDFGFSRFLHTDSVVVTTEFVSVDQEKRQVTVGADGNDNKRHSRPAMGGPTADGTTVITISPSSEALLPADDHPCVARISPPSAPVSKSAAGRLSAPPPLPPSAQLLGTSLTSSVAPDNNKQFSALVSSPVVPKTPMLFPATPPNGAANGSGSTIGALISKSVEMGSQRKGDAGKEEKQAAVGPAPLLLLTSCGTDKYLPYEVLLWSTKSAFYPSPPTGLPPSYPILLPTQPQLRPTTTAHAKALDAYAIGVIAHVLLSGRLPFDGHNKASLFLQQHALKETPPKVSLVKDVLGVDVAAVAAVGGAIAPGGGDNGRLSTTCQPPLESVSTSSGGASAMLASLRARQGGGSRPMLGAATTGRLVTVGGLLGDGSLTSLSSVSSSFSPVRGGMLGGIPTHGAQLFPSVSAAHQAGAPSIGFAKGEEGICALDSPAWRHVSDNAKNLVRGLLHVNPTKRLTIQQALASPWMKQVGIPTAQAALPADVLRGLGLA